MAMASRVVAFIVLLLSLDVVSGQHSPPPNLEIYPGCAIDCITAAFEGGVCAPTDQTCTCTDEKFQSNVTDCVTTNCTIIDALATKNITSTGCGDPIRDRSRELVTITVAMGITAAIFVILRFSCKMFVVKVKFGMDDWFVLASAVATTPSIFINVFGTTANGLGRDIWTLQPDDITSAIRYFWAVIVLYFLETALTKLSIICFYIQIFPSTKVLRVLWATFAVTSAWGVAFVLAAIFQCQPTSHFWNHWDGLHEGHCANPSAIGWSNAAMNIAFDLWILAIPLSQLRKLQLHWKKKVGVVIMFCLGTFVTVVSILRLQSLATFTSTTNITWNFYELSRWSTVEICLGIVCACLPTVRLLCVRMFPVLGGSLHRRTSSYHFQANTARGLRSHAVGLFALDSSESDQEGIAEPGPAYHKEHTLHFSEHEDTNAICIHGLDASGRIRLYHNLR